jgi:hypothetical protein
MAKHASVEECKASGWDDSCGYFDLLPRNSEERFVIRNVFRMILWHKNQSVRHSEAWYAYLHEGRRSVSEMEELAKGFCALADDEEASKRNGYTRKHQRKHLFKFGSDMTVELTALELVFELGKLARKADDFKPGIVVCGVGGENGEGIEGK